MHFEISRQALLPPLKMVSGIVEKKQTLPILANTLIKVDGEQLHFTATDTELEISCTAQIESDFNGSGVATLPAQKLFDICRSLGDDALIQINKEEDARAVVKSGRSRFTLSTLPADDFPSSEEIETKLSFSMPQQALKYLFSKTQFAMAQQDVRYYLNGLLLDIHPDKLNVVATDGHRLALAEQACATGVEEAEQVILPRKAVLELARILEDKEDPVKISLANNHIRFELSGITLTSKLIDGRFPDYHGVLPMNNEHLLTINCTVLKQALNRAAILSNEKYKGARLKLGANLLEVSAHNPEQEQAEEEIDAEYQGDELEIGFSIMYLLDALNAVDTEHAELYFSDPNSSCLIRQQETDKIKYVVMPMRL